MTLGHTASGLDVDGDFARHGAPSRLTATDVMRALGEVRTGAVYDLEVPRFPGMPGADGHVPLQVLTHRTPAGQRLAGDPAWSGDANRDELRFITDVVLACSHTGTHIDALSHFTRGPDDKWFDDRPAGRFLSDAGPTCHDGAALPPVITRGVLLDVASGRGVDALAPGYGVTSDDLERACEAAGVTVEANDAVLIRTGWMVGWPTAQDQRDGVAGLTEDAARWLCERDVVLIGADNPTCEQLPSADPGRPRVVHPLLLLDYGIPILELAFLEQLARDRVATFALFAAGIRIRGATAAMVRPLAVA